MPNVAVVNALRYGGWQLVGGVRAHPGVRGGGRLKGLGGVETVSGALAWGRGGAGEGGRSAGDTRCVKKSQVSLYARPDGRVSCTSGLLSDPLAASRSREETAARRRREGDPGRGGLQGVQGPALGSWEDRGGDHLGLGVFVRGPLLAEGLIAGLRRTPNLPLLYVGIDNRTRLLTGRAKLFRHYYHQEGAAPGPEGHG
eukprot:862974-Prorocentrum_minimum.AAC.1